MPDSQFYTQEAARNKASQIKTLLATSKMRFIQAPFTIGPTSVKADLVANEATFDGYPAGGYSLTAWTGPANPTDGGNGAVITSPMEDVVYGPPGTPPVTNYLSGWWVELTGGEVWLVGNFNPTRPQTTAFDAFNFVVQSIEGRSTS